MKREFLEGLGLEKEVIDKIMAENGKDIEKYKTEAETQKTELEGLKTQLADANKQIEEFKGMDIDGIKKAAEDYKTKFEQAEADSKAKIEAMQFEHALDSALSGVKAKNPKAVKALLDMEGLKLNNGEVIGLKEQLEKIKADNDYLFESDKADPTIVKPTPGATVTGDDAVRSVMGLPSITK